MKYPVITFVHADDVPVTQDSVCERNCSEDPIANSTIVEHSQCSIKVVRHDDPNVNSCCCGSSTSKAAGGCHSHSTSQCCESNNCKTLSESPRNCAPTKSKECKSQCSLLAPKSFLDLTPCTPVAQPHCESTPRDRQSRCSTTRHSVSIRLPKCTPCSVTKTNVTQCSNIPNIESVSYHTPRDCPDESYDVGHISHIPRIPPCPSTYEIPCIPKNVTTGTCTDYNHSGQMFGLVKLGENDVCYTSGTIEWVGRKRSYPINTGFKLISETNLSCSDMKKVKTLDQTYTCSVGGACDCADVLPTVNTIVDHLNALHEAVDIVDLRLNTLEHAMTKNCENLC